MREIFLATDPFRAHFAHMPTASHTMNATMTTATTARAQKAAARRTNKRAADVARADARCEKKITLAHHSASYFHAADIIGGDRLEYPAASDGRMGGRLIWLSGGPYVTARLVTLADGTRIPAESLVWLHQQGSPETFSVIAFRPAA